MAPLATGAVRRYRRGNLSKSLDRLVEAELVADPMLGPATTDAVLNEWLNIHNDPRGAVIIAGLLRHGDVAYLEALEIRASELLSGLEMLPTSPEAVVQRIVRAVSNNFVAAQRDEMSATQTGTSAVLSAIDKVATPDDVHNALAHFERLIVPPEPRVILLAGIADEVQQQHLNELIDVDRDGAARLGELLQAQGVAGLSGLVRFPPGWASDQSAAFWRTAARILAAAIRPEDAGLAFTREAERPDVDDRVRALIDIARCAEAGERTDAKAVSDARLAEAQAIDPEHPMVLLFVADRAGDAERRLALTEAVPVTGDQQVARKESQRAMALLALGRYSEAKAVAQASIVAAPFGGGPELSSVATIMEEHSRRDSRSRDDRPLMDAVAYQLSLYQQSIESGRYAMAGLAAARAALGTAVLGDRVAACELIDEVSSQEEMLVRPETRSVLVEAALTAQDAVRAQTLLEPHDGQLEGRVVHATVAVLSGAGSTVVNELDILIEQLDAGDLRSQAVTMRLLAAADPDVEFDSTIAADLPDAERLLAQTTARRAMAAQDFTAARAALAGYDDPMSLATRAEIAELDGVLTEAIGLTAALARSEPTAPNVLRLAALRGRARDYRGAIRDAMRLATDDRKITTVRDAAYGLAAQAALDAGDFEELEDISERWAELSPEREDPKWAQLLALARQSRHSDGLSRAAELGLEPTTDLNRHLLWAELISSGSTHGHERMRRLMELSDKFGRPEELERAFISGVLKTPPGDRGDDDPEVIARFQEAMSTFEQRFPDAEGIHRITVEEDEDPESLIEKLKALQPPHSPEQVAAQQDAMDGLPQGRSAVAFVAAMAGRSTPEVLVRNSAHPLGVFDRATAEAEIAAAAHALDRAGASWDETACVTIAQLPTEAARRLRNLLPDSRIGQAVRDALAEAVQRQMGGEQVASIEILPDGTPRIIEERPGTVAKVREVQSAADAVAAVLTVSPDQVEGVDDRLGSLLTKHERRGPFAALVSALLTARAQQVPLFSDDRVVRAYGRSIGVAAFGSIALTEAAHERGLLDPIETSALLTTILDIGVWGVALAPDAYVDVARRANFALETCGRALLADEALLRVDPRLLHNARLLAAVAQEAPENLDQWAEAIVQGYVELLKLDPTLVASLLIAAMLQPDRNDVSDEMRQRNVAVIRTLRAATDRKSSEPDSDPLVAGIGRWLHTMSDSEKRAQALENLLLQIDPGEQPGIVDALAGSEPAPRQTHKRDPSRVTDA